MCDTLGFINGKTAIFAKNSDRSPNEPQVLEYFPASVNGECELELTYIKIPQVKKTHGVLLSRPTWLWGAEMGVNDCGVCIGNEAVWTLGAYGKTGLTGMDLLRLALERSENAESAVKVIIELLERYGQGGNCGYDHDFYYDNSFLVMDKGAVYVLETCGKKWVYKKCDRASISNRLCIGTDGDVYSEGKKYDFALRHTEHLYNIASGSAPRRKQTSCALNSANSVPDMFSALRTHNSSVADPFAAGTVSSTCMHFGGMVGDHTTQSFVVDIKDGKTLIWATGSSAPCVSLFKPIVFGEESSLVNCGSKYWYEQEFFRRKLIGKKLPEEYYAELNELQESWLKAAEVSVEGLTEKCLDEEKAFFGKWDAYEFENASASGGFIDRWSKKTAVLMRESEKAI